MLSPHCITYMFDTTDSTFIYYNCYISNTIVGIPYFYNIIFVNCTFIEVACLLKTFQEYSAAIVFFYKGSTAVEREQLAITCTVMG